MNTGTEMAVAVAVAMVMAATPLLLAALGELVCEKAGVLNLGVEGSMLVGAVTGFAVAATTGHAALAIAAAAAAGAGIALLFGFLTLTLLANQVAAGLALTLFGTGLSTLIGRGFVGMPLERLPVLPVPVLSELPVLGPVLFNHDALVYGAVLMAGAIQGFLHHTRPGLVLRAVGESHDAAHAIGYPVIRIRYRAVLFGGAMSGLAGAYLSLAYTPLWTESMTAGRGWIALALVVFATWRPWRVLLGSRTVRRRHHRATPCSGIRHSDPGRVFVDAALSRNHRRAGADFARCRAYPA